jgi:isoquinoline 1-oxidoreductase subunit beta
MARTRRFVLGSLALVGGLGLGWSLLPPRQRLTPSKPLPLAAGQQAFTGWLKIAADGAATVQLPKSEMGQGIHTALALVLADELDADWPAKVRVEHPPLDGISRNLSMVVDGLPFHPVDDEGPLRRIAHWMTAKTMREIGVHATGGSSSVKDLWGPMRQAGASARRMLMQAAAQQWGVPITELSTEPGRVVHQASKRSLGYGELAARAAALPLAEDAPLKAPEQWRWIGKPQRRLEAAAKSDGTARFGLDVRLPGMLYASVRMCPVLGGTLKAMKGRSLQEQPGVKAVVRLAAHHGGTAGVAMVAQLPWQAMKAVEALEIEWDTTASPGATFDSAEAMQRLVQTARSDEGFAYRRVGDVATALAGAARRISAEYQAPYLAHATLEPQNCTVRFDADKKTAEVWAPTQVPGLAKMAVADVLGIDADAVTLHVTLLGGGFGRRLEVDIVAQAAEVAKAVPGTPVQTFWSRAEDTRHDFYRPACAGRFEAGFDAEGKLVAWQQVTAGASITNNFLGRVFGLPVAASTPDKVAAEGGFDQAWRVPNTRFAHAIVDSPVPVGYWRSVGHSHQAFFKESFVDECAHALGRDALAFRAALVAHDQRTAAVLDKVRTMSGWGSKPVPAAPDGAKAARGVALHFSFGSVVAQVAEVSLGPDGRTVRVHRVHCAIDCGTPVNPDTIVQQMESGIVFGLSAALYSGVEVKAGAVQASNFHDQPILRLSECPAIEVAILPSTAPPEGVGEPGTPPIAPAVANALFALTGQRLRSLPLKLEASKA